MTFKQKIYNHFLQVLTDKVQALQNKLAELKETGSNETKSTAGDKHETALAMIQIEQENTRRQWKEALEQKLLFGQIDPTVSNSTISKGSLIKTDKGYLFLSVAIGKATVDGITVMALSPQSPVGIKLLGLKENDEVEMNGLRYGIEGVE